MHAIKDQNAIRLYYWEEADNILIYLLSKFFEILSSSFH